MKHMRNKGNKPVWDDYWKLNKSENNLYEISKKDNYYSLLKYLIVKGMVWEQFRAPVKIVEIGCGSGIRTLTLLMEFPDRIREVIFFDQSECALNTVKESLKWLPHELHKKVSFIQGDIFQMPFEKDSIDIAWNEGVVEHFSGTDRADIFKCIYDVVKPEGFYLCLVPNFLNLFLISRNFLMKKTNRWPYGYQREFSIFELHNKMRDAGFEIMCSSGVDSVAALKLLLEEIISLLAGNRKREAMDIATG